MEAKGPDIAPGLSCFRQAHFYGGNLSKEWRQCRRKYKHPDYLSALRHAAELGDPTLVVYPCGYCGGLHVGHPPKPPPAVELPHKVVDPALPVTVRLAELRKVLRRTYTRLHRAQKIQKRLHHPLPEEGHRAEQRVRDLYRHLRALLREQAWLEKQVNGGRKQS
jgi:hypothetical protein